MFGEYDFMVQKLLKSYIIDFLQNLPALKLLKVAYRTEMMELIGAGSLSPKATQCLIKKQTHHYGSLHNDASVFLGLQVNELTNSDRNRHCVDMSCGIISFKAISEHNCVCACAQTIDACSVKGHAACITVYNVHCCTCYRRAF